MLTADKSMDRFADGHRFDFSWLSTSLKSTDPQSMEYIPSHTLDQAFFGQCHHLPEVSRAAELAYGKILRSLGGKLDAGRSMYGLNLLLVILTSAAYETLIRDAVDIGRIAHTRDGAGDSGFRPKSIPP